MTCGDSSQSATIPRACRWRDHWRSRRIWTRVTGYGLITPLVNLLAAGPGNAAVIDLIPPIQRAIGHRGLRPSVYDVRLYRQASELDILDREVLLR